MLVNDRTSSHMPNGSVSRTDSGPDREAAADLASAPGRRPSRGPRGSTRSSTNRGRPPSTYGQRSSSSSTPGRQPRDVLEPQHDPRVAADRSPWPAPAVADAGEPVAGARHDDGADQRQRERRSTPTRSRSRLPEARSAHNADAPCRPPRKHRPSGGEPAQGLPHQPRASPWRLSRTSGNGVRATMSATICCGAAAGDLRLRGDEQPVGEHGDGELLHVVGQHVVAVVQRGRGLGGPHQVQRRARRGAEAQVGRGAGRRRPGRRRSAAPPARRAPAGRSRCSWTISAASATGSRSSSGVPAPWLSSIASSAWRVGVAHRHARHEAVALRLGQRVGAFHLDRVLRGDDHERRGRS